MDTINKLETKVVQWYKDVPHLPQEVRKWLAVNMWWLTLIGVILGGIGVIGLIAATFFAGALLSVYGGVAGAAVGGLIFVVSLLAIAFLIVTVVLGAIAVTPLKSMQKKGWTLLFMIVLVRIAHVAVTFLFSFNLIGLVWALVATAVGAYFLFEIRDFYGKTSPILKAATSPVGQKANTK